MRKTELKLQDNYSKKELILGSIFATIIAISPFLFNLYESVPDTKVWDTFLFSYDSKYYESVYVVAWTLAGKVIPLILLLIWFFTCRHWWYHTIIVPISMFLYQIIQTLNSDLYWVDKNLILYMLPIMAVVIPSIYLIRAKMFDKLNTANKSLEELEDEFMIKPTTFWGKIKQYF
ncbi:hypothetical protein [Xanthomarina sp. F2636L]|uniref:hypothetical protein n=1 Tax=Xanthomarina sp. F2636L TaxID=2996018 RepID=UPI00225E2D94|nr:hypothetical protein [Xanthomarina sp. F2636L]MCX7549521.1 hypothetical protein [Xanthomarina sp. F2636L]